MLFVFLVALWLHELAEGMNGRARDVEHEAGDIAEDDALLLGELGRKKRTQDKVIEL